MLERLVKTCDVLVENFAPGALDRMRETTEHIHALNPRMIVASVKGFGPDPTRTARSTRTWRSAPAVRPRPRPPRRQHPPVTGAQIGDSGTGLRLALGIVQLYQRRAHGRGQQVLAAAGMACWSLCRVKLRDQQRLRPGPLGEYPGTARASRSAMPRRAPATNSGGGQPGVILKCKGWEMIQRLHLLHHQAPVWRRSAT